MFLPMVVEMRHLSELIQNMTANSKLSPEGAEGASQEHRYKNHGHYHEAPPTYLLPMLVGLLILLLLIAAVIVLVLLCKIYKKIVS